MNGKLQRAASTYRMWHQKHPDRVDATDYHFPDRICPVGFADAIVYESDKWEADGDFYDYHHEFDSDPEVFMEGDVAPFAPSRTVSTARLLRTPDVRDTSTTSMPLLATVKTLVIKPFDGGPKHNLNFRNPPPLCCTTDKKTLVILSETMGPIIISGGRMVITDRGIVR